jgi:hypothetical protein
MDFLSDKSELHYHGSYNCNSRSSSFGGVPITAAKHLQLAAVTERKKLEDKQRKQENMIKLDALAEEMAANPQYKMWKRLQSIKEREMEKKFRE